MSDTQHKIATCLWYDSDAEEAATLYTSGRAMEAMLQMRKLDIAALEAAFQGMLNNT